MIPQPESVGSFGTAPLTMLTVKHGVPLARLRAVFQLGHSKSRVLDDEYGQNALDEDDSVIDVLPQGMEREQNEGDEDRGRQEMKALAGFAECYTTSETYRIDLTEPTRSRAKQSEAARVPDERVQRRP